MAGRLRRTSPVPLLSSQEGSLPVTPRSPEPSGKWRPRRKKWVGLELFTVSGSEATRDKAGIRDPNGSRD